MAYRYRFGDFLLDTQSFRLVQGGKPLAIEPKALNVLIFLVQHQGRLVERREILSAVWNGAFVTDHVLNRAVGQLRKILDDDAKQPRYIETVPTLGYRFLVMVEIETPQAPVASQGDLTAETEVEAREQTRLSLQPGESPEPVNAASSAGVYKVGRQKLHAHILSGSWRMLRIGSYWIAVVAALAAVATFVIEEPAKPAPLESTQITSSTDPKQRPIFTDGSRLYFERRGEPSQMAVSGGVIVSARMSEPGMHLLDISADGSKMLAWKFDLNDKAAGGSLWVGPMVGGAARKLAENKFELAILSPDGHSVIAGYDETVYGIDERGGNWFKLWKAPGLVSDLSFSPDGKHICVTVEGNYVSRIWILRADGKEAHLLAMDWPANEDIRNGHWTRDGQHFVFRSDGEGRQNMYEVVKPDWMHFWRKPGAVRLTGNQIEILASVPLRGAAGLIVLGRLDQGAMKVFDPKSNTLSPFLDGLSASVFVISPDRRSMAYIEYPSGHLWKSRVDGSGAVQLTDTVVHCPQWSPDSKSIVYSDWHKLYLVPADGGPSEKLIPTGDYEAPMTWTPDGKSIVFNCWDGVHTPHGLYVLDMASRKVSAMAGAESYYVPLWSPDGKYMAAIADNPLRMVLYSAESKSWRVLRVGYWNVFAWAPDSKSIYMPMVEERNRIYRIGVPEGTWKMVAELDDVDSGPDVTYVSLTNSGQPVIMSHTGVPQFYTLRWPR